MVKLRQEDIKTKEVLSWKGLHLFHFTFSACSMKTRIFLGLKNIDYTGHHINLQKKENFSPFFQGITPRSLLPVLVDDGEVHIESNDILEYLDNKFPANRLIPSDKKEEINQMMIEENNLHLDIRNVTFKFLVPRFLNRINIQEKTESKATLNGASDPADDLNRDFWEKYKKEGITDEVATKSLLSLKLHLEEINEVYNKENKEMLNLDIYRETFENKNYGVDIISGKTYDLLEELIVNPKTALILDLK